jgi:hypothetical protein
MRTKSRTSTKYGTYATLGGDAGGGRIITERTASTVVPGIMVVRGDGTAVGGIAGNYPKTWGASAPFFR